MFSGKNPKSYCFSELNQGLILKKPGTMDRREA